VTVDIAGATKKISALAVHERLEYGVRAQGVADDESELRAVETPAERREEREKKI